MTFDDISPPLLAEALAILGEGFDSLPAAAWEMDQAAVRRVLSEAARRLHENYPYHHPLYCGQMLKPPHPAARLAYVLAMHLNPNNHALDGGRASSLMEKEAVAQIAAMFGWETHLGHLTSGGTFANFEALWIGRELAPGQAVAASAQAHYTHSRLSQVLQIPFRTVPVDGLGRMNVSALERMLGQIEAGEEVTPIGTVVATLGTTAAGAVDPLDKLLELRERFGFRIHVDAAYGGYHTLAGNLAAEARRAFDALGQADSIVIDPHKHGLQPYGCGCVLFHDPRVGRFYRHNSPYTYFTSQELHLGEISLECSRPGASAVALWATMRLLPLQAGGAFAQGLEACRAAALELHRWLLRDARFAPLFEPELDIVVWGVKAERASEASRKAREVFDAAARLDLHLALASFPREMAEVAGAVRIWDDEQLTCLRSCVMKPEHREWMGEMVRRLDRAAAGCSL